ncbi:MAG: VOC family protein [Clostridium sp.]|uniref:VOC family protein n=1 Tax=Clostridium sp. TaxID=1506 RepID=UPI00291532F4|nr:VOC family protein [Clostridium sp.]MDU7338809.1 VOC family protein [Clostridium sp.]
MNRVNLISIGVRDMAKSLEFYKKIGFQTFEKEKNPLIVFFNNEGSKLELYPIEKLAEDINEKNPPKLSTGGFCGITFACNLKSEEEVDAFLELVERSGGTIAKKAERVFWGGYSGYFQDPDGYYWEAAYGPHWEFDENNMLIIKDETV